MEESAMKCEECGGLAITEHNAVRRYEIGGLPHVELHGIEVTRCTVCGGEEIAIPRIEQLHRLLAEAFIKQHRNLAPVEIRFLRKHMGHSMNVFAEIMGVTRETVSRWETGGTPMGSAANRLLRLLVVSHEPPESYVVDDLLRELSGAPAPERPSLLTMRNRKEEGWRPEKRALAMAL
jgi:putative transcriptional regulator